MFTHLVALAALAARASAGCDVCSKELYDGRCGPFEREARDKWADWTTLAPDVSCLEDVCCALHEDDCCEPAAGPIAGLVIGAVVLLAFVGGACLRLCGLAGAGDAERWSLSTSGHCFRNGPNPSHVGLVAFACGVAYLVALMPLRHWTSYKLVVEVNLVGRLESRARFDLWHGAVTTKNDYLGDSKDEDAILADPEDCNDGDQFCKSLVEARASAGTCPIVVLWFNITNKGFWPVIGVLLMWRRYRDRCRRRHATRNLHGLARGRMPLRDGNVVDALRDGDVVVRDALAHLADRDRFFEAPEVLPPRDHPVYRDALPGPPITSSTDVEARLEAVNAWLERHDDAAAAFLERVNGTATVLGEDDAIAVSDDVACGTMGCGL